MFRKFTATEASRLIAFWPSDLRRFSAYKCLAQKSEPRGPLAATHMAFARPNATLSVHSRGSTAKSISGFPPFPTFSPVYNSGASSLLPSPITIRPVKLMSLKRPRIASTAAPSAAFLSPLPYPPRRRDRRHLGNSHKLEREIPVHNARHYIRSCKILRSGRHLRFVTWK